MAVILSKGRWVIGGCEIALKWMSLDLTYDKFGNGLGNDLVPPDNKPLPEPV